MAFVSIHREPIPFLAEIRISISLAYEWRFCARLKSEPRSRGRFTIIGWPVRLFTSPSATIEDGIIFGWSLQRALHPPLVEAEQRPRKRGTRIHFPTLIIYIYFIYSLSRPARPARHRRDVIREKPGEPAIGTSFRARRSPDSRLIEGRVDGEERNHALIVPMRSRD